MTPKSAAFTHPIPERILLAPDAVDDPLTQRVLSRLPGVPVEVLTGDGDPLLAGGALQREGESESERFTRGKQLLLLKRYRGSWLKACPGTSGHVCCNLWIVNPGEGCPLDCTYCYLQSYLRRNPTLKLYTNLDEMKAAIGERASREPSRLFRVGTGEIIDSLIWDPLTDTSLELVPFFARLSNAVLELKTKSSCIGNLLELRREHGGRTVVSWSVNARSVTRNDEARTAGFEQRIDAARQLVEAGYRVGFHLDPLIHFEGWEDEYRDTVQYILQRVPAATIAWFSISSLRYKPDLQQMMLERFPQSKLPFGEQFLASDGKLRYFQPLRVKMLNFVWRLLKEHDPQLPVYMCMESAAAWRTVAGGPPAAGSELAEVFSRRARLPVISTGSGAACVVKL